MVGITVISRAAISDRSRPSLSLHSDVIQITDGLHRIGDIVGVKKETGCKLLLGLGVTPGQRAIETTTDHRARAHRLKTFLPYFDYIELDAERDLVDDILCLVPPEKRLITCRYRIPDVQPPRHRSDSLAVADRGNVGNECDALVGLFRNISGIDACLYRIISSSGIAALEFLYALSRQNISTHNVVAYAEGAEEIWSRIAAPCLGARVVFADSVSDGPAALESLVRQFGLPNLPEVDHLYGIAGGSVMRSLSPAMHNAAFRRLGCPALYLPFPANSMDALLALVSRLARIGLTLNGLTMTSPLKEATSERFTARRRIVDEARSANVLRLDLGSADTTDDVGLIAILQDHGIAVAGKRVAVTGCGGSGRVAARALAALGADVVMYNRGTWRARLASELLNLVCRPLSEFRPDSADLIVNAIPIPVSHDDGLPFSISGLHPGSVLIDYSYSPASNALLTEARRMGSTVIDGLVTLEKQLCAQFKCLTGQAMPAGIFRDVLQDYKVPAAIEPVPAEPVVRNPKNLQDIHARTRRTQSDLGREDEYIECLLPGLATGN